MPTYSPIKRDFRISYGDPADACARWKHHYSDCDMPDKVAISGKLTALLTPTKAEVDAIIGNESWTSIWCSSCQNYTQAAVEVGFDYPAQICEECLVAALRELRKFKKTRA